MRLNQTYMLQVKEARNKDPILKRQVLITPGGKHMMVTRHGSQYSVRITDGPYVNRHKPAVDVLFRSVARAAGENSVGVLLTGMGSDGAQGLLEMKQAKAYTMAQSEESCVVYGMPKAAKDIGAVMKVASLQRLPDTLIQYIKPKVLS